METDAREVINRLYTTYAGEIYRYARLTLNDDCEAYDVVQEVFVRAFKAWHTFRQESTERTWLMKIARNYLTDLIRKRQSTRTFLSSYTTPYMPDDQIPADTLIAIEQALTLLSETYRQVFILRKVQDLSVADTAKILGWSQVKVRVTYSVSGIGFADRKKASGISF